MADISKITLPSGNTYDIKDAVARQAIAGGVSFIVAWNGTSAPVVADIPTGVVVTYNNVDYTGTLDADDSQAGAFYLVHSSADSGLDIYDEYVAVGTTGSKFWEKLGDTQVILSSLGSLAYKDTASVTFTGNTTDTALGTSATFTTSVTPATTYIKASASGTAVGASSTDKCLGSDATFTTTVTPTTSKLVTTTVPNVTSAGSASTWSFTMGTGTGNTETLIISGANSTAPTLGTAKTVATGSIASDGGGSSVATGITSATTTTNSKDEVTAVTGVSVSTQPTITLATDSSSATGRVQVATGISSATTTVNSSDTVTAITALGTGTAS